MSGPPRIVVTDEKFYKLFVCAQLTAMSHAAERKANMRLHLPSVADAISDDYESVAAVAAVMVGDLYGDWARNMATGDDDDVNQFVHEVESLAGILISTVGLPWIEGFVSDIGALRIETFGENPPLLEVCEGGFRRVDQ